MNKPNDAQIEALARIADRMNADYSVLLDMIAARAAHHRMDAIAPGLQHRDEPSGRAQAYGEMQQILASAQDKARQMRESTSNETQQPEPQPWEAF